MLPYGWMIDEDHVTDDEDHRRYAASNGREGLPSRAGWIGPRNIPDDLARRLRAGEGIRFHLCSDDRSAGDHLDFAGRVLTIHADVQETLAQERVLLAPLTEFGMADAGCTTIRYWVDGSWQHSVGSA